MLPQSLCAFPVNGGIVILVPTRGLTSGGGRGRNSKNVYFESILTNAIGVRASRPISVINYRPLCHSSRKLSHTFAHGLT